MINVNAHDNTDSCNRKQNEKAHIVQKRQNFRRQEKGKPKFTELGALDKIDRFACGWVKIRL